MELLGLDIDGCLIDPESKSFSLEVLQVLRQLNEAAGKVPDTPRVFFCSGRPHGFVEALMRVCACRVPSVFENGTGLVMPNSFRIKSLIPDTRLEGLEELYTSCQEWVKVKKSGRPVPGKIFTLSFYPDYPERKGEKVTIDELDRRIREEFGASFAGFEELVDVIPGPTTVDLIPSGFDKSVGVQAIAREEDVQLSAVGGIGDASNDLGWLRIVGRRGVPSDADDDVKEIADTIASAGNVEGVMAILNLWFPQTRGSVSPS